MKTSFIFKNLPLDKEFNFSNSLSSYGKKCIKYTEILVPYQSFENNEESTFGLNLPRINCFNPQTKSNLKKQLITYLVYERNFKNKRFAPVTKTLDKKPIFNKDQVKEKLSSSKYKSKILEKLSQTKPIITRNINKSQSEKILCNSPKKIKREKNLNSVSPSVYYNEQQTNFTKDYSSEIINSNIPSINNNNLSIFGNCLKTPLSINKNNNKRRKLNFSCDIKSEKSYLYNGLFNKGMKSVKIYKNKSLLNKILNNNIKNRHKEKEKRKCNTISLISFENN